jgi:hypothetical protein
MSNITHYDGCWEDPKHHACALREIERLHRWLSEMVADYKLDADPHPASQQGAINELIHRLRALLHESFDALTSNEDTCNDFNALRGLIKEALGHDPLDR